MKIYVEDRHVPYKTTGVKAIDSKRDIDAILAHWGIKMTSWVWDMEGNHVELRFQIKEIINDRAVAPVISVEPPRIWNKASRRGKNRQDSINWDTSMRVMYWYIKTHLEMSHLMQSSKTEQFLPYVEIPKLDGKLLKDVIIPSIDQLEQIKQLKALPQTKILEEDK